MKRPLIVGLVSLSIVGVAIVSPERAVQGVPASDPSVTVACAGTTSGATFTLTASCDTTAQLTVPDATTLDGAGFTITAHDPVAGNFSGAVLTNAGTSMSIENLTIDGTGFATDCGVAGLYGIFFNDAGGSVKDVTIHGITQHSGCPVGIGIRANGVSAARTVTIATVTESDYQKAALVASGSITVNVSHSTFGPPDATATVTQNGVQYSNTAPGSAVGASGTVTDSTIYGSGNEVVGSAGTAVLLYGADGVTLSHNVLTGAGTDEGIAVTAGSTHIHIVANAIGRTAPDDPDPEGFGVRVDPTASATLVCNTFSGWNHDIVGAVQVDCTPIPVAMTCKAYQSSLKVFGGTPPYRWTKTAGSLPAGVHLATTGTISGTPKKTGRYPFRAAVADSTGLTATQVLVLRVHSGCPPPKPPPSPVAPVTPGVPVTG